MHNGFSVFYDMVIAYVIILNSFSSCIVTARNNTCLAGTTLYKLTIIVKIKNIAINSSELINVILYAAEEEESAHDVILKVNQQGNENALHITFVKKFIHFRMKFYVDRN